MDAGIVGSAPGTFITEKTEAEQRRSSTADPKRPSVSVVTNVLRHGLGRGQRNVNLHGAESSSIESEQALEQLAAKQARGETFASGGETRYYKPIDTYEGRHRWDPEAEWTEGEEKRIIRKVIMSSPPRSVSLT